MEHLPPSTRPGGRHAEWRASQPRYVVADADGTLLGPERDATEAVVAALARLVAAGVAVGVATGRPLSGVAAVLEQVPLPGPHIVHNGALVCADGAVLASWPLPPRDVRRLVDLCIERGWYAELHLADRYLVTDRRPQAATHWWMLHQGPDGDVGDVDLDTTEVIKATVVVFDGPAGAVAEELSAAGFVVGAATSPQAPGVSFLNVTDAGVDKGVALARVCEELGITAEQVVAIGDGHNDLPLLAAAGTAIAMGQAPQEVREAAHLVVPGVDVDGAVAALDACGEWLTGPRRS